MRGAESAQERQLRAEIERMKEEEAARAKQEARSRELKDKIGAEEKFARINRLKVRRHLCVAHNLAPPTAWTLGAPLC